MAEVRLVEFPGGLRMFTSSAMEARFLHDEIFGNDCYQVTLPAEPLVIDVGANIGMFTLYVKRRYPTARVLAFEPASATAAIFRRNVALHQLRDVILHEVALGAAAEASAPFTYYPALPGNSTRYPERKVLAKAALGRCYTPRVAERLYRGTTTTVRVEALAAYLADGQPVDLLKIDAEGAELDVLRGIGPAQWPLIRQVCAEVHDTDGTLAVLGDLLESHGFVMTKSLAPLAEAADYLVHAVRP
jgi:FkbM family methyltransferase